MNRYMQVCSAADLHVLEHLFSSPHTHRLPWPRDLPVAVVGLNSHWVGKVSMDHQCTEARGEGRSACSHASVMGLRANVDNAWQHYVS